MDVATVAEKHGGFLGKLEDLEETLATHHKDHKAEEDAKKAMEEKTGKDKGKPDGEDHKKAE